MPDKGRRLMSISREDMLDILQGKKFVHSLPHDATVVDLYSNFISDSFVIKYESSEWKPGHQGEGLMYIACDLRDHQVISEIVEPIIIESE